MRRGGGCDGLRKWWARRAPFQQGSTGRPIRLAMIRDAVAMGGVPPVAQATSTPETGSIDLRAPRLQCRHGADRLQERAIVHPVQRPDAGARQLALAHVLLKAQSAALQQGLRPGPWSSSRSARPSFYSRQAWSSSRPAVLWPSWRRALGDERLGDGRGGLGRHRRLSDGLRNVLGVQRARSLDHAMNLIGINGSYSSYRFRNDRKRPRINASVSRP